MAAAGFGATTTTTTMNLSAFSPPSPSLRSSLQSSLHAPPPPPPPALHLCSASPRSSLRKKVSQQATAVFEEDIYNIDDGGPELSAKEIIELAGVQVPKRLVQQLQKEKEKINSKSKKEVILPRKTHKILRVISGKASGKKLLSVADSGVRPMMEVVRGAVFDMLLARIHGFKSFASGGRWLDLYSGTGSVGIEALSRGCTSAHFVEMDPWITENVLKKNLESTEFTSNSVVHIMKVEAFLQRASKIGANEPFDYISVTPPYEEVNYMELLGQLSSSPILGKDTFVVVEYPSEIDIIDSCGPINKIIHRRYGRTHLAIYGPEWAVRS